MTRFACTQVFTPRNRNQQRVYTTTEFHCNVSDLLGIAEEAMIEFGKHRLFEVHKDEIIDCCVGYVSDVKVDKFEFTVTTNGGEYFYTVSALHSGKETPATDENIVAWAKNRVAHAPTLSNMSLQPSSRITRSSVSPSRMTHTC